MKRILTIVLCFVLLNKANAQADKVVLDNVFQNINKATIPTGYLQDYGVAFVNKESYNGLLTDSNAVANLSAFRLMYNDVYTAKINPSATSMPNVTNINNLIEPLQGNTATPLIFNISNIAGFHPDAILNNMITYNSTTQQFHPIAGQNPWVTHRFFAACPIDAVSPTTNSLILTYNSSLVFSNCGKQISNVSINFYDGAGYQALANGGTLTQTYIDSSGYKPFAIKVVCTDGSVYECYSLQYVHVTTGVGARYASGNILPLAQNVNFFNTAPTPKRGTMQVIYSNKRPVGHPQHKQLVKPLIIINGLDETDVDPNTPANLKRNLSQLLLDWNRIVDYDFNSQLDDIAGYDLIYINYFTLDKIEHNADMLISMINWINANKAAGADQNVVMGIELGGLISRYALATMTKAGTTPTQTRLLITHDAPHQGAYMPLGYQHLAEDFGEMDYWGTSFKSMISDYQRRDKLKQTPVFLQFYLHRVDGSTVSNNIFLAPSGDYHTMVDFPSSGGIIPTYQFIATSQGSQCGTQVMPPGSTILKYEEKIDDDPFAALPSVSVKVACFQYFLGYCLVSLKVGVGFGVAYKTKLSMNALPSFGTTKEISYAAMEREIFVKLKVKLCFASWCVDVPYLEIKIGTGGVITQGPFQRFNPPNTLPYESFAGGTDNLENFNFKITGIASSGISWSTPLWEDLGVYLGLNIIYPKVNKEYNVVYSNHTYSYISRVSALDIANPVLSDYSTLLSIPVSGLNKSKASTFLCHEGNNNGGITQFNLTSGRFTKRNATWMFNTMQGIPNTDYCFSECGKPFISGPSLLCIGQTATLNLNGNIYNATSVNWSIGSSFATVSPPTGINTVVTGTGNGATYAQAYLTNVCPTSQPNLFWFDAGTPARNFNIVSYPLAVGQPEPTCFPVGGIHSFLAENIYSYEHVSGWEWSYKFNGVTYSYPYSNQSFSLFPFESGTYEIFVKHKNNCGVSTQESTRIIEVEEGCGGGWFGRSAAPSFSISASPNPVRSIIHLQTNTKVESQSKKATTVVIELYKAYSSNKVKEFKFNKIATTYHLPVNGLESGLYYLVYSDGTNRKTLKVIVQ